jgi:hypothetical protein
MPSHYFSASNFNIRTAKTETLCFIETTKKRLMHHIRRFWDQRLNIASA